MYIGILRRRVPGRKGSSEETPHFAVKEIMTGWKIGRDRKEVGEKEG